MPLISVPIAVSADDGWWEPATTTFLPTASTASMGRTAGGDIRSSWFRFQDVQIPTGQTIFTARIRFQSPLDDTTTACNLQIVAEDADSPSVVTSVSDANGRIRTTAVTAWNNVPTQSSGAEYVTVNFAPVLQEIVDRGGWASGNAIQLFIEDNGSDAPGLRRPALFDHTTSDAPVLEVLFGTTVNDTGWMDFGSFAGNGGWLVGSGTRTWTNPGNAAGSDDAYATRFGDSGTLSAALVATNAGIDLPDDAEILGIEVRAEASFSGSGSVISRVGLTKNGTALAGTMKTVSQTLTETDTHYVWGSPSDLWGDTWLGTDIEALGFGFGLNQSGPGTCQIDHMQVRVFYISMANLLRTADVSVALQILGIQRETSISTALLIESSRDADVSSALSALGITRAADVAVALRAEVTRQADVSAALQALDIERDAGITIALGVEESLSIPIAAGTDDGWWNATTLFFNNNGNALLFGNGSGNPWNAFARFQNVTVPPGTTLTSARLRMRAQLTRGATVCNIRIVAEDSGNPSALIDATDGEARPRTTAVTAWNDVEAFTDTQEYVSPDFAPVLNEVFAHPDWTSGNAVLLFIEDNGSDVEANRRVASVEEGVLDPVTLELTWIPIFQRDAAISIALEALGIERNADVSTALKAFDFQRDAAVSISLEPAAFSDLTRTASVTIALRIEPPILQPGGVPRPPEFTITFTGPLPDDATLIRMGLPPETALDFSSSLPGGWATASAGVIRPELRRMLDWTDYQKMLLPQNLPVPAFAHGTIYDEGGNLVWEGRVSNRRDVGGEIRGVTLSGYGITALRDTRMPSGSGPTTTAGIVRRIVDASLLINALEIDAPSVTWDWSEFSGQPLYNVLEAVAETGDGVGWTWTIYNRALNFFSRTPPDQADYVIPADETIERDIDNEGVYTRVILTYDDLDGTQRTQDVRSEEAEQRFGLNRALPLSGGQMTASAAAAFARTELAKRIRVGQAVSVSRTWDRGLETLYGSRPIWRVRAGEWLQIGDSGDLQLIESVSYSQQSGQGSLSLGQPVSNDARAQWRRLLKMETAVRTGRNVTTRTRTNG